MGYCHYWYIDAKLDAGAFAKVAIDFEIVANELREQGIQLAGTKGTGYPTITPTEIAFNGFDFDDAGAHEGFILGLQNGKHAYMSVTQSEDPTVAGKVHDGTKTARKPYDIAVQAALIIAKHHLGDAIQVDSDGDIHDWQPAIDICSGELDYGDDFKLWEGDY